MIFYSIKLQAILYLNIKTEALILEPESTAMVPYRRIHILKTILSNGMVLLSSKMP